MDQAKRADLKANREFARNLMDTLKDQYYEAGITADQALHVFSRMAVWNCFGQTGLPFTVNLTDMIVVSGSLETAYLALSTGTADEMNADHHWLSQERIDFIKHEIGVFLGFES